MTTSEERKKDLSELIRLTGGTPLLVTEANWAHVASQDGIGHWKMPFKIPNGNRIVLKLEHLTKYCPTGSGYDRVYPYLLKRAEEKGFISPENTRLIECSVGNAATAFCFAARFLGYKRYTVILPQDIYPARIDQVRQLGGRILFSPSGVGPYGYINLLQELLEKKKRLRNGREFRLYPISKIRKVPQQPYRTLLDEVSQALCRLGFEDSIDAFTFGIGSGNTVSNIGRLLKDRYGPEVQVVVADFKERPFAKLLIKGLTPQIGGQWIDPDYKAATIHGVPLDKLNLDKKILSDAVLLSREDRDYALDIVNNKIGLSAGRGTATTFGATLQYARSVSNQTIFSLVFDSLAKYGTGKYNPLWDLDFAGCDQNRRPNSIWGSPRMSQKPQKKPSKVFFSSHAAPV